MIQVVSGFRSWLARLWPIGLRRGGDKTCRGGETDELEQGTSLHEFVLPHPEQPWLQDRPCCTELIQQRRGPAEHLDQRAIAGLCIRLRRSPDRRADAERAAVGVVEHAQ